MHPRPASGITARTGSRSLREDEIVHYGIRVSFAIRGVMSSLKVSTLELDDHELLG